MAIEGAVTLASPELDPVAKAAKDVSAAAVFIAATASLAVGWVIFLAALRDGACEVSRYRRSKTAATP